MRRFRRWAGWVFLVLVLKTATATVRATTTSATNDDTRTITTDGDVTTTTGPMTITTDADVTTTTGPMTITTDADVTTTTGPMTITTDGDVTTTTGPMTITTDGDVTTTTGPMTITTDGDVTTTTGPMTMTTDADVTNTTEAMTITTDADVTTTTGPMTMTTVADVKHTTEAMTITTDADVTTTTGPMTITTDADVTNTTEPMTITHTMKTSIITEPTTSEPTTTPGDALISPTTEPITPEPTTTAGDALTSSTTEPTTITHIMTTSFTTEPITPEPTTTAGDALTSSATQPLTTAPDTNRTTTTGAKTTAAIVTVATTSADNATTLTTIQATPASAADTTTTTLITTHATAASAADSTTTTAVVDTTTIAVADTTTTTAVAGTTPTTVVADTTTTAVVDTTTTTAVADTTTTTAVADTTTTTAVVDTTTTTAVADTTTTAVVDTTTTAVVDTTTTTDVADTTTKTLTTTRATTAVAAETTTTSTPTKVTTAEELFEYGYIEGDWGLTGDDSLAYLYTSMGFPTDSEREYNLYISTNGYITLGRYYNSFYARRFPYRNLKVVAPFWTDSTTYYYSRYYYSYYYYYYYYYYYNYLNSRVYYQIYTNGKTRYGKDSSALFDRVNRLISSKKNVRPFKARWILKVTWYNLLRPYRTETNTFQCILATDYQRSFALILYASDGMRWSNTSYSYTPGIGFQMSRRKYYNSPYSKRLEAMRMDRIVGNAGKAGMWVFQLDDNRIAVPPAIQCLSWYEDQTSSYRNYFHMLTLDWLLSDCPCSIMQAFFDPRFTYAWWEYGWWEGNYCFYTTLSPWRWNGARKCCYKLRRIRWRGWWGWRYIWSLNTDLLTGGGLVRYNPVSSRQYRRHLQHDKIPHQNCCLLSGLCAYYREYRWLSSCSRYRPVRRARFWGDPHITTLDGKGYTFNGWGEYILLEVRNATSGDLQLVIQGRTDRAQNQAGEFTDATIFSAFAAKDFQTNATMSVQLNTNKTDLNVYCNTVDHTRRFQNRSANFNVQDDNLGCNRPENKTLRVTFLSGISLNVSVGVELLEISVTVPEDLGSTVSTRGLLGVFNGNQSDDFTTPEGTVVPINSTEKEIFHNFGQKWLVQDSDSVFHYRPGDNASNHRHDDFTPKFLSNYPQDRVNEARKVCQDNNECIFDYLSTNRSDVAVSTLSTANSTAQENAVLSNNIPSITVDKTIKATVGEEVQLMINASDADNEHVTIYMINNITGPSNLSQTGNIATLTWMPESLEPVIISLSGTDESGGEAPTQSTRVLLCSGCSGHGQCDFNQTDTNLEDSSSNSTNFIVVPCTCDTGWIGEACDQDYDACGDDPCPSGTNCTDLSPEEQQAMNGTAFNCSNCPPGLEKDQSKCIDIDECNATEPVCDQLCFNTEGSFTCACKDGYSQNGKTCIDNNECDLGTHDCDHICANTDGGYNCSCEDGYVAEGGGRNCTVDPNNDPCQGSALNCEYGCRRGANGPECFCTSGYALSDQTSCTDIDECGLDLCEQRCTNTEGGFMCGCYTGFQLHSDKLSCNECDGLHWGEDCRTPCECSENSVECHNTRGCVCSAGWEGDSCDTDVDECAGSVQCEVLQTCVNSPGSYECVCIEGYEDIGGQCIDIDECSDELRHTCEYECVNGQGGYECKCAAGYTGQGNNCTDIDECSEFVPDCEHKCVNTEGSYFCDCLRGYELADDRRSCRDIDKLCENSAVICDQICTVNDTSLDVICLCRPGYRLINETHCEDIDECKDGLCSQTCNNMEAGYRCSCNLGYQLSNDGKTCEVCDQFHWGEDCAEACKCGPGGTCNHTQGCVCDKWWTGPSCKTDIQECQNSDTCEQSMLCVELLGSYRCDCQRGYKLINETCQDIDECDESIHDCAQICRNTIGSYTCLCQPGYRSTQGEGRVCEDIDECSVGHLCEANCKNTGGSYVCSCYQGFTLSSDRLTCQKAPDYPLCGTRQLNCSYGCSNATGSCFCPRDHDLESDGFSCKELRYRVTAKVTLELTYTSSLNIKHSDEYKRTTHEIQEALWDLYEDIRDVSTVLVTELREGSISAIHEVVFSTTVSLSQTQRLTVTLRDAYSSGSLTVGGVPVRFVSAPVLITRTNTEFVVTQPFTCEAEPCDYDEVCFDRNGEAECFPEGTVFAESSSDENSIALSLGLGLGLALGLLSVSVALVLMVKRPWADKKSRSGRVTPISISQAGERLDNVGGPSVKAKSLHVRKSSPQPMDF